jgi:hypothetical protein
METEYDTWLSKDIGWIMPHIGLKRLEGVWHVMPEEIEWSMAPKILDGVWRVMA